MTKPMPQAPPEGDHVDHVLQEWRRLGSKRDLSPVAVVARLGRAASLLDRGLNENFAPFGLNRNGWDVLASLRRAGSPYRRTPTELYRSLMRTSGAMTHLLDSLEQAGLVERTPDPNDRRGTLVGLSRKGRTLVDRIGSSHLATEERLLAALTQSEREQLAGLLRKLLISLEEQPTEPPTQERTGGARRASSRRRYKPPAAVPRRRVR